MKVATHLRTTGCTCLLIAMTACGGDGSTPTVGPDELEPLIPVDSVAIVPPQQFFGSLSHFKQILALALDEDGSVLYGDSSRFSWSSSAPDVVSVDQEGGITSVGWGTATVTATEDGGATGTTAVTVRDAIRVDWSLVLPGGIDAGNVMGSDGTIYAGTNDWNTDSSTWYAISPGGDILWSLPLPYYIEGYPAIGSDGALYLASWFHDEGGRLIAVDPDGSVRWVLEDLERIRASPAIGPDGTIYVPGHRYLYAIDPMGEVQWAHEQDDNVFLFSSPAVASDGTIYVGGDDRSLYAINPDGTLRWTFGAGDRIRSSPSIGPDGTIYFGSHDGRLYAVHPDGTERWSVEMHCGLPWGCLRADGIPSIGPDGTIYMMVDGVYAVDPDGSVLWHFPANQSSAAPILGADGTVYVASIYPLVDGNGDGRIFALDPEGRLMWEHRTEGSAGGSPLIGLDGTIFAAASGGLVAIVEHESANGGFEGAPWPQVRRDRANSGRAGG